MTQKIVIRVPINRQQKSRSKALGWLVFWTKFFCSNSYPNKALKIAVSVRGVESAAIAGQDKDQLELTGDGIDAVELTTLLRKKVGYSVLVSVGPVPEKKDGGGDKKKDEAPVPIPVTGYYNYPCAPPYMYEIRDQNPNCSIM